MRREIVLLMVISLGGCLPDQAKELATCQTEADRFFQAYNAVDPDDPRSQYIIACMAAKGYDFTVMPEDCDSRYPFPTQPACYEPHSWLNWIMDKFHRALKSK